MAHGLTDKTVVGEANTASNIGAGGVGLFDAKVGVDLQFRNIDAGSNKVTVTNDAPNDTVDIDVVESNLTHDNIGGTLSISKGGTGQTTKTDAFDALAPTTTKGDLIAHNGTDNIRLPVGSNGQLLQSDSTQAAGVSWVTRGRLLTFEWILSGAISTGTNVDVARPMSRAGTIVRVTLWRKEAGGSGSLVVDLNKNGTTMYTTQANRPTIAASSGDNIVLQATMPDITAVAAGDYLTIDVDDKETGSPKNLCLVVELEV